MKTILVTLAMLACAATALCQETPEMPPPPRCRLVTTEPYQSQQRGTYKAYSEAMPCALCKAEIKTARDNKSRRCEEIKPFESEGFRAAPLN